MHKQYQTMHLKTKNEVKYWRKMWKWCCSSGKTQGLGFSMHQGPSNFASHEIKMSSYIYIYESIYLLVSLQSDVNSLQRHFYKVLTIDFKSSNSEAQLHLQALEPAALDHVGWIGRKEPHLQTLPIMFRCIPHILNA